VAATSSSAGSSPLSCLRLRPAGWISRCAELGVGGLVLLASSATAVVLSIGTQALAGGGDSNDPRPLTLGPRAGVSLYDGTAPPGPDRPPALARGADSRALAREAESPALPGRAPPPAPAGQARAGTSAPPADRVAAPEGAQGASSTATHAATRGGNAAGPS